MSIYRVKQFIWAITSYFQEDNIEILNKYLNKDELEIFMKLKKSERMHSLRVYNAAIQYVEENELKIDRNKLAKCSLLHDIGKTEVSINIVEKSIFIILNFITGNKFLKYNKRVAKYYKHGELGANILANLKEDDDIVECVKNHHNRSNSENLYLKIISICDDYS